MSRELDIAAVPHEDSSVEVVRVSIRSDTERDISVDRDAQDVILWVARVMGWSVSVDKAGGAGVDPGA